MGDKGAGAAPKIVSEGPAGALPVSEGSGMVDVRFVQTMAFPVEVMLPLRLIIYNGNVRRKLITGNETTMPQPLAEWLAKSSTLSGHIQISPVTQEGG